MGLLRRAARVYADEGFGGLGTRLARKALRRSQRLDDAGNPEVPDLATAQLDYARLLDEFQARSRQLGCADEVADFYWYHTIDLGNGLVTPGDYDYRSAVATFPFPADMRGMTVLDVGSATGFFAFAFERRGADVVSVELPSLADWDILGSERPRVLAGLKAATKSGTLEEAYHNHADGPFRFCQRMLGSKVRRCYSTIYDLTPAKLGREQFDLVYAGNILVHLFSPLKALDVLAGLCKKTLIATIGSAPQRREPSMTFQKSNPRAWWAPNRACMEHMLSRLGFAGVQCTGHYSGWLRRAWHVYHCDIIEANRA